MGWYDSIFGGKASDPLEKLDPKLREFLDKESPVKFQQAQQEEQRKEERRKQADAQKTAAEAAHKAELSVAAAAAVANGTGVPKESLYQDGRYAHLWKNYRSLSEIEDAGKTDHEKLQDVLEGYKSRKEEIGRAALENCALEQLDWRNCMNNGTWEAKLTMCSKQVKKFERCYTMQARLLKTLGYLSSYDRPASVDEDIQMHADALYHRMVEREDAIQKAKDEKKPIPQFEPISIKPLIAAEDDTFKLSEEQRKEMKDRLAKVPEQERSMEEEAIKAEYRAQADIGHKVQKLWKESEKERERRKKEGQETVMEKVSTAWRGNGGGDK